MKSTESFVRRPAIQLSTLEKRVLNLLAQKKKSKEIAQILGESPRHIRTTRIKVRNKLEAKTLSDLIAEAIRLNLIARQE